MKNENGVYTERHVEILATRGRSSAEVRIAECNDGLFRAAISYMLSIQGMFVPITDHATGYATYAEAKSAGIAQLIRCFPVPGDREPDGFKVEVRDMRRQIEQHFQQPSLF